MDVVSINIQYCGCYKSVKVNPVNNMFTCMWYRTNYSSMYSKWNSINTGEETIQFVRNLCFNFFNNIPWIHFHLPWRRESSQPLTGGKEGHLDYFSVTNHGAGMAWFQTNTFCWADSTASVSLSFSYLGFSLKMSCYLTLSSQKCGTSVTVIKPEFLVT